MMSLRIDLEQTETGVILPVQARPGAKQNGITGEHNGALKVSLTQVPEKGKANAALIQVLAKQLGLKKSQIRLISGQTSTRKKFQLTGADCQTIRERILQSL
jgi:uncharacterized protein (TIGR00251 family)